MAANSTSISRLDVNNHGSRRIARLTPALSQPSGLNGKRSRRDATQRSADARLPVGRENPQIAHVDQAVVRGLAADPVLARLPARSEPAEVGHVNLPVKVEVPAPGELHEHGRRV